MQFNKLSLAMILLLPLAVLADDTKNIYSKFKESYHQYKNAVAADDKEAKNKYALQSYQLGTQVYGKNDINTASLAFNLASLYNENSEYAKANALLLPLPKIYQKEYGTDSLEHIDLYFALAKSTPRQEIKKQVRYYQKALNITDKHKKENPTLNAQIQFDAGVQLLAIGSRKSKVILEARDYFIEHFEPNDTRVVNANFFAGKYYLARKKLSNAIATFEANIPIYEALDGPTHTLELATRAFLIDALERSDQSEEATKHCIAIGSMTPWSDSQEQKPLYRTNPKYPINLASRGKSGFVEMEFTVSDVGFVKDISVLESGGGKGFETAAIAAVKHWRYAPKFDNGKAVDARSTVRIDFTIN